MADELETAIKPDEAWNNRLGAKASLTKFIEKAILADAESPILFFLDEADLIFNKDALRQILRENRCADEKLFQRLRAAGMIRGETRSDVKIRCQLYAEYFKHHLG